jgi:MYXO-CTERM domain-containing protein
MRAISRFGPPVALMAIVFFLSHQPDLSTGLGGWDTVLRKLAHMASYGTLWFLWWRAFGYRVPAAAVLITLLYAISDEWHQSFVEGRHGTWTDVVIDMAGVGLAGLAIVLLARRRRRSRPARPRPTDQPSTNGAVRP